MKTYNTHKPYLCIDCKCSVGRRVKRCPDCNKKYLRTRPNYERTQEMRQHMSDVLKGRKHDWNSGSTRPEVAEKIRLWWTPERKEARRQEALKINPSARYHGLSSRRAKKLVLESGYCKICGGNGQESRLGVHHIDRNKHNQEPDNLVVLCHSCHMKEHAQHQETGWDSFWKKRKTNQD